MLPDDAERIMARKFPREKHRALWREMAKKSSEIIAGWKKAEGVGALEFLDGFKEPVLRTALKENRFIHRYCYCCEFAFDPGTEDYVCRLCPLEKGFRCIDESSPFQKMITAMKRGDADAFRRHALEIAESPLASFVNVVL